MADIRDTASDKLTFIVLKTEKLSRAVYVVSDFMSDSEPIKWKLRRLAVEMTESLAKNINFTLENLSDNIPKMISIIDLALASSTVSQMNFVLIKKEYAQLFSLVNEEGRSYLGGQISVPLTLLASNKLEEAEEKDSTKETLKDKRTITQPKEAVLKPKRQDLSENGGLSGLADKKERQDKIIGYLRGKDWVSIKDITHVVPNFSAKTVQRELTELVGKGLLKKKGERRWSRYALNGLTV